MTTSGIKREIRAGSITGIAGIGAVVDIGKESFLIPGIGTGSWHHNHLRALELPRLSTRLHKVLKVPKEQGASLTVHRFPRAMFCDKCRKITHWRTSMETEGTLPHCPIDNCGGELVAMRFVMACENGHLDDVPWEFWAHSGPHGDRNHRGGALSFIVDPTVKSGGLDSVFIKCACGSKRSLEDLPNKRVTKELFKCTGNHPWVHGNRESCKAESVILQRGATNLHFPSTLSALDIPELLTTSPAAEWAEQVQEDRQFPKLVGFIKNTEGDNTEYLELLAENIGQRLGCSPLVVREVANAYSAGDPIAGNPGPVVVPEQSEVLDEEWQTISRAIQGGGLNSKNFMAETGGLVEAAPPWVHRLVDGVLLIRRLREVRAYLGFQRVKPGGQDKTVPPDVGGHEAWLPASEVFGEGIVLSLDMDRLEVWADQIPEIEKGFLKELEEKRMLENYWFIPVVDPIFIAMHTLSHLLLRRVTFECGYSSSSLRERLYFNRQSRHAGVMIYTADGDSEGSLGGLVRQGQSDRLSQSLSEAVDQGAWCSADPVCTETAGQGLGGFNRAACHACSLVSETSCTLANTLLDRRMLFDPAWGLLPFLTRTK